MTIIPQGTNIPTDKGMPQTEIGPKNVEDVLPTAKTGPHIVKDDPKTAKIGPKNVEDVPPTAKIGHQNVKDVPPTAKIGNQNVEDVPPIAKIGPKSDKEDPPIAKIGTKSTHMIIIMIKIGITKVGPDKIEVGPDKGLNHPTNKGQDHPAGKDPKDDHPIRPKVHLAIDSSPQSAGIVVKRVIFIEIALNRGVRVPFDKGQRDKL